jgi:DNA-directed RNA polymerase specialized sigma24 family protein
MRKKIEITSKDFNGLLEFLSSDAEEAGIKYENIRQGLIKYFYFRGCLDPEALTDETINRVAMKLPEANFDEKFVLANYFYSFAANIYLEELRRRKRLVSIEEDIKPLATENGKSIKEDNPVSLCMEICILKHSPDERALLLKYYGFEKNERAEQRKILAAEQNISDGKLYVKISRLRKTLRECLKKCLNERNL